MIISAAFNQNFVSVSLSRIDKVAQFFKETNMTAIHMKLQQTKKAAFYFRKL